MSLTVSVDVKQHGQGQALARVQELCESRGGRLGLSVLMSLTVSVDRKKNVLVDVKRHVYLLIQSHLGPFSASDHPSIR